MGFNCKTMRNSSTLDSNYPWKRTQVMSVQFMYRRVFINPKNRIRLKSSVLVVCFLLFGAFPCSILPSAVWYVGQSLFALVEAFRRVYFSSLTSVRCMPNPPQTPSTTTATAALRALRHAGHMLGSLLVLPVMLLICWSHFWPRWLVLFWTIKSLTTVDWGGLRLRRSALVFNGAFTLTRTRTWITEN